MSEDIARPRAPARRAGRSRLPTLSPRRPPRGRAIGGSATFAIRRAARCLSGSIGPTPGKGAAGRWADVRDRRARRSSRPHPRRRAVSRPSPRRSRRRGAFCACRERDTNACRDRSATSGVRPSGRTSRPQLIAASLPIAGTLAETYLRQRGILTSAATSKRCGFIRTARYRDADNRPLRHDGRRCSPSSPTSTARRPASTAPISLAMRTARRRSRRRADRWAQSSVTASRFGSCARRHGRRRRRRDRAVASNARLPTMPMVAALSASNLAAILPPDRPCAGSTSLATPTKPALSATAALCRARCATRRRGDRLRRRRLGDFNDDLSRLRRRALSRA